MSRNLPGEDALIAQRERIVRLCAWMTNDPDAAEDLAQETLIVAWRRQQDLRDPQRFPQWLSRIAHNVCLKWASKHGKELARSLRFPHFAEASRSDDAPESDLEPQLIDDFDLELELERKELAELLDRALALLPPETRTILIQRYIEESPLNEIAAHLGVNPNAAAKRLERGKLTFRRVLTTQMSQQLAPYLIQAPGTDWEDVALWCHICGQHRLKACIEPGKKLLRFNCPGCNPGAVYPYWDSLLTTDKSIKGYKRAFFQTLTHTVNNWQPYLATRRIPCVNCGEMCLLQKHPSNTLFYICHTCRLSPMMALHAFVLVSPAGCQFSQQHTRIRRLPTRQLETDGRAALVTGYESVTSNARLEIIVAEDTFEILHVFKDHSEITTK